MEENYKRLKIQMLIKFGTAPFVMGLFFFLPAGTFNYWQAWVYIGVLCVPAFFVVLLKVLIISPKISNDVPSSIKITDVIAKGVAPIIIKSFIVPHAANFPRFPPGKIIGSIV